jgi:uncharacterized membrane protein (UPF0127 family)
MSKFLTGLPRLYRSTHKGFLAGLLLSAALATMSASIARGAEPADLLREFNRAQLIIDSSSRGCILFDIYIANSSELRSQGLMFIRSMDEYEGMLFIFAAPAEISMWMKNTLIPLDMLFIDGQLTIASIHKNATPLSTDIISSGSIVEGVIELNGGSAERFGIVPGDRIIFPAG